jgi:hypothetical protein
MIYKLADDALPIAFGAPEKKIVLNAYLGTV